MTRHQQQDGAIRQVEHRLSCYTREVESEEPWRRDHDDAMGSITLDESLSFGLCIYDKLVELDEAVRAIVLRKQDRSEQDLEALAAIRRLIELWLRPCERVEKAIADFEAKGYQIHQAEKFRACHAEAAWMLRPAGEAFDHDKFVEARDRAIDDSRRGEVA